jgi:hypothetical protein
VTALLKALAPYRKAVLSGLIAAGFAALSVTPGGIETDMWHNAANDHETRLRRLERLMWVAAGI